VKENKQSSRKSVSIYLQPCLSRLTTPCAGGKQHKQRRDPLAQTEALPPCEDTVDQVSDKHAADVVRLRSTPVSASTADATNI
jgi:hypothetical protein